MCMEDINLGRRMQSNRYRFVTVGNQTQVLGPNPDRIRILFSSEPSSEIMGLLPGQLDDLSGVVIGFRDGGVTILRIEDVGKAIQGPWYAYAPGDGQNLYIIEVLLPRE